MSPYEIEHNLSVMEVKCAELYDSSALPQANVPRGRVEKENGLLDLRLGSVERKRRCRTCGLFGGKAGCPGHFGHIDLAMPVFFVMYLTSCKNLLNSVCYYCSRLLVDKDALRRKSHGKWDTMGADERWHVVTHSKRTSVCPYHCTDVYDLPQPQYSVEKIRVVINWDAMNDWISKQVLAKEQNAERGVLQGPFCPCNRCGEHRRVTRYAHPGCNCELCCKHRENAAKMIKSAKSLTERELTAADASVILAGMHEDDLEFLGVRVDPVTKAGHPKDMILEKLPVEPRPLRPPSAHDKGRSRSQNDKTHKYQEIMKANLLIREQISQATNGAVDRITPANIFSLPAVVRQHVNSADVQTYEWQIATLFHNEIKNVKVDRQRSGKPFKSLNQQFKGKHGWWRQHAVAKRCDQTARAVVTPCNALDIDELGVPLSICLTNTKPVTVTSFNIGELTEAVRLGPDVLGGASHLKDIDGEEIDLRHCQNRERIELRVGMTVDRYLKKGDIVMFNRQPTLHRSSIMAHKVVPMKGSTFRLNLTVTTPYNADFDGKHHHCRQQGA